jgi:predicted Holliday junction resolvase-like endonuclease
LEYLIIIILFCVLYLVTAFFFRFVNKKQEEDFAHRLANELKVQKQELEQEHKKDRKQQIERQRYVLRGQVAEQFAPFTFIENGDKLNPADWVFIGNFVDFIVLHGYADLKDGVGEEVDIYFVEVKTGKAQQSKHQRAIKRAVEEKRIHWRTYRIPDNTIDNTEKEGEGKEE